jgi:hypothetical protein
MGLLIAGLLACTIGGQAASGGGAATTAEAPTSQASGGSPLDNLDPCTVLTQDDATAIFGVPADPGKPTHATGTALCLYANADKTMGLSLQLTYDEKGGLNASDYVDSKDPSSQDVPGLGDGAYFNALHHLVVAKGQWFIVVNGLIEGNPVPLEKLTPLAQTVLGRLP